VLILGAVLIIGTTALAARLIWEMTWLTWREGPQMVGFSLAHGYGGVLLLFPPVLVFWICIVAGTVFLWKCRHQVVASQTWVFLIVACSAIGTLSLPQSLWNFIFAGRLASSQHAADLLVSVAADGEKRTIRALIDDGVPVNSTNYEGDTALHAAASTCRPSIMTFLLEKGADINATNLYGDSPLQRASERHCFSGVTLLEQHSARNLKGSAEQRDRASHAIVVKEIERQNSRANLR